MKKFQVSIPKDIVDDLNDWLSNRLRSTDNPSYLYVSNQLSDKLGDPELREMDFNEKRMWRYFVRTYDKREKWVDYQGNFIYPFIREDQEVRELFDKLIS